MQLLYHGRVAKKDRKLALVYFKKCNDIDSETVVLTHLYSELLPLYEKLIYCESLALKNENEILELNMANNYEKNVEELIDDELLNGDIFEEKYYLIHFLELKYYSKIKPNLTNL